MFECVPLWYQNCFYQVLDAFMWSDYFVMKKPWASSPVLWHTIWITPDWKTPFDIFNYLKMVSSHLYRVSKPFRNKSFHTDKLCTIFWNWELWSCTVNCENSSVSCSSSLLKCNIVLLSLPGKWYIQAVVSKDWEKHFTSFFPFYF